MESLNIYLARRTLFTAGSIYLLILIALVSYAALRFRDYYVPPTIDRTLGEDEVLQLWEKQYQPRYQEYRQFLGIAEAGLALCLSLWAAAFGIWKKSILQGLIALAVGGAVTTLALSVLPWVYFPFDQYPVSALWLIGKSPWIALGWLLASILGRRLISPNHQNATSYNESLARR